MSKNQKIMHKMGNIKPNFIITSSSSTTFLMYGKIKNNVIN